jgi:epoxide hydrolase-like predicted phosphatase
MGDTGTAMAYKTTMNAYIFDMGNVIIRISTQSAYNIWAKYADRDPRTLSNEFETDDVFRSFEKGHISSEDYFHYWRDLLKIDITYREFVEGWNSIYEGLFPEAVSAVKNLASKCTVVALTNTNEIHSAKWPTLYPEVVDVFDRIYKSNEIGLRKPDAECFNYVLAQEKLKPEDCMFFDDVPENVTAATNLGIQSVLVKSSHDILKAINN